MNHHYSSRTRDIITDITKHLPQPSTPDATLFAQQFYGQIPLMELELVSTEHAAAVAHDAFSFFGKRQPDEASIRVFEPNQQTHGFDSHRLFVQIISDDKPFLVDSLSNALNDMGFTTYTTFHPIFRLERDDNGQLTTLMKDDDKDGYRESLIHFELSPLPEDISHDALTAQLQEALRYIDLATDDWSVMLTKTVEAREAIGQAVHYNEQDVRETQEFLDWLMHKNFVFLGYAGIDFSGSDSDPKPTLNHESLLGISKVDDIPAEISLTPQLADVRKASRYSKVHRHALMDVITVKRINKSGHVDGEHRFYGLFTSTAYYQNAIHIPLVGRKIEHLLSQAGFPAHSHSGKALVAILQFMPRDELFQISEEDLFDLSMGVLALEARPGVKLFARMDVARRYISALVYVPRELFSTDIRYQVSQTLEEHFHATIEHYETYIGESSLARLHIIFRTSDHTPESLDIQAIEKGISTSIMLWSDRLREALSARLGEQQAERLFRCYAHAFDAAYTSRYPVLSTVYDIKKMEACLEHQDLEIELYQGKDEDKQHLHVKIYNVEEDIALSDILPKLEHMGLHVLDEFPYVVKPADSPCLRIRDIRMRLTASDVSLPQVKPNFETLLLKTWHGEVEDDWFNGLVFNPGLNVAQIELLRGCCQYLRQINFTHGKHAISMALLAHPELTLLLVQLFEARFDPHEEDRDNKMAMLSSKIEQGLSHVDSLTEDRIISTMHQLIMSILRSNYFKRGQDGASEALSFKIDSANVPNIPLPKPHVEIFVYSARVEGTHLRGGKVARGGLRWSDRREDFRTEVLGLMKAQMVKNAVIVPVGSKGGFVVKRVSPTDREAFQTEGKACYKNYLRSMLDITDNVVDGAIVPPNDVVRHDGDDPYLVVAADKGTATFSDMANGISAEYDFWLDDAFASGGSVGYDHKAMGITARGAWVSVERHFWEMGHDMKTTPFTVVGIGDMNGDVFGNGMLLSENIKLVAAFNHLHIFLDPDPDPAKSFVERKRLFEMERSSWMDYDTKLISSGGGVFERSAKSIALTPEIQRILDTDASHVSPDELIQIILKAPVDLLWNGGIGTYVKASHESHEDAGDRANNHLRIDATQLRTHMVGEGGNLGLTQPARIEYAKCGGRINTDAIDNSAGVDCSDHEVNIKIGLQQALADGSLSLEERNAFLESMTDDVAELVLRDNQLQTQAISVEQQFAAERLASHTQLMRILEKRGLLDRGIEHLPDEAVLTELRDKNQGLTRPEISVLLAYGKITLFSDIMDSAMPDEPYFSVDLLRYFPKDMQERFESEITKHSLKREIIATVATNSMVNRAGIGFYFDILEDTKLPTRDIVAAYSLARDLLRMRDVWADLEKLEERISPTLLATMYHSISDLLKTTTFWLLRHHSLPLDIKQVMDQFCSATQHAMGHLSEMLTEEQQQPITEQVASLTQQHIPDALAQRLAQLPMLGSLLDICSIADRYTKPPEVIGKVYFALADSLHFLATIARTHDIMTTNRWDRIALQSLTHEYYDEMARITDHIFERHDGNLDLFISTEEVALDRMLNVVGDMLERDHLSSPMLMVALQQLKQVGH